MAISKIQYDDKVAINIDSTIPDINKCNASDLNEIKNVVNNNADEIPSNDNLVNVGLSVDTDYKTNILTTKNLFDKDNANVINNFINSGTQKVDTSNNTRSIYIPCMPNTTYCVSKIKTARYAIGTTSEIPTTNVSLIDMVFNNDATSLILTTSSSAKYLMVYFYNSNYDTQTYQEIMDTLQIELGSTPTIYEAFIPNTINVNNEKYTDTINVGTEINDKNRVNVLYSHNLFDKNNANIIHFYATATGFTQNNNANSIYIPVEEGKTYTISSTNRSLVDASAGVAYTNKIVESTSDTYLQRTIWSSSDNSLTTTAPSGAKYMYCYVKWSTNQTDINNCLATIQIEESSTATPYEPYITPSINVDGEEIYSRPKVLWTNSDLTAGIANNANFNLNGNIDKYYEIKYVLDTTNTTIMFSTGLIEKGNSTILNTCTADASGLTGNQRQINYISDNQLRSAIPYRFTGTTRNADATKLIPYQIIGYK